MNDIDTKRAIVASLKSFAEKPLVAAATALMLKPNTFETFAATFAKDTPLNRKQALSDDWQSVNFLFQLTDEEVRPKDTATQNLFG
jgi:hypothetical protein